MEKHNRVVTTVSKECRDLISKYAEEEGLSIAAYVRKKMINPWYIAKTAQFNKLTVYFNGEIIKVQVDDDNRNSQSDSS